MNWAKPKQGREHKGRATEHLPMVLLRNTGLKVSDLQILRWTGDKDLIYLPKELFLNIGKEVNLEIMFGPCKTYSKSNEACWLWVCSHL